MQITMLAAGSRGDVLPYAELGRALRQAGYRVRFATFENFQSLIEVRGLDFFPVPGDVQAVMAGAGGQALAASGQSTLRMALAIIRSFGPAALGYADGFAPLAKLETDLIVSQLPGGLYGYDLAEALGVPLVTAAVMPLVPTRTRPMLAFPAWPSFLPGYNRATYRLAYQMVWQAFRPAINRWRREKLGLGPAPRWGIYRQMMDAQPLLNGFSTHVVPRPLDWGSNVHVTGYWFPGEEAWAPPEPLRRFLDAGPPPVFVGFGSMPVGDAARVVDLVVEALRQSGQRGILGAGWGGLGRRGLPDWVFPVEYAPYGWLFPRMAAIVHHGGSGTTGFGVRAGVPSLVVPFLFDQFYWGRRLAELGVGPEPIPFKRLTAGRLADAIGRMVAEGEMSRRAAALGAKVRAEDGLGTAVTVVEQIA